jgi:RND family efflux transporter MFP subunit
MIRFLILNILTLNILFAFEITGIVQPISKATISVSTDGMIENIILKEGSRVKKNQVILKMDDNLQKLETQRRKIVLDDKTKIKSLEDNLVIMKDLLVKKEKLYKDTKAISLNELNQLKMQLINIKGELAALKANEKKEKIEYVISKEVLKYYEIKSPINGQIVSIKPQIGEWVQTGNEVANIINIDKCYVEANIDVNIVQAIKIGTKLNIEVNNGLEVIKKRWNS